MTVSTQTTKITYNGDGATTLWSFSFPGHDPGGIFLFITDALGNITQVPSTQYSVSLNDPIDPNPTSIGGTVQYPISALALAPGNLLTIVRILPIIQDTSIVNQSIIYPPVVEQEFDYGTLIDQQLAEMVGRAVKVGIADTPMAPLPELAFRKNQQAVFDSNGNLTAGGVVVETIISGAMIPVVTSPTLAGARTAMGVPPIDSPIFTGNPQGPTPPVNDNDTSLATTAFVQNQVSAMGVNFPSGTRMIFQQSTPPAGWIIYTAHNDKALRVVNASPGAGGVVPFSTFFGRLSTDAHTLTTDEMPFHGHAINDPGHYHNVGDPGHFHPLPGTAVVDGGRAAGAIAGTDLAIWGGQISNTTLTTTGVYIITNATGISIGGAGLSQSHSHGLDTRVQYVDVIIGQKS